MNQGDFPSKSQSIFAENFSNPFIFISSARAKDVAEWDSAMDMVAVGKVFSVSFRIGEEESTRHIKEFAGLILKTGER
jgi:hypothetical protein